MNNRKRFARDESAKIDSLFLHSFFIFKIREFKRTIFHSLWDKVIQRREGVREI